MTSEELLMAVAGLMGGREAIAYTIGRVRNGRGSAGQSGSWREATVELRELRRGVERRLEEYGDEIQRQRDTIQTIATDVAVLRAKVDL